MLSEKKACELIGKCLSRGATGVNLHGEDTSLLEICAGTGFEDVKSGSTSEVLCEIFFEEDVVNLITDSPGLEKAIAMVLNDRSPKYNYSLESQFEGFDRIEKAAKDNRKSEHGSELVERYLEILKELRGTLLQESVIKVLEIKLDSSEKTMAMASSEGFYLSNDRDFSSLTVKAFLENNDGQVEFACKASSTEKLLEKERLRAFVERVKAESRDISRARPVEEQVTPLVFAPGVYAELFFSAALAFLERTSSEAGLFETGTLLGSELLTVVDDPGLEAIISFPEYDDEGTPVSKAVLLENGVLKKIMGVENNDREAARLFRPSIRQTVDIAPTNIFIAPGKNSLADIINSSKDAIYVRKIRNIVVSSEPPLISAEIVLGNRIIPEGEGEPVTGNYIVSSIKNLFYGIVMVGNELIFSHDVIGYSKKGKRYECFFGSPAVKVEGMKLLRKEAKGAEGVSGEKNEVAVVPGA